MNQTAENYSAAGAVEIRPFQFKASDVDLADLRMRIEASRWPGFKACSNVFATAPLPRDRMQAATQSRASSLSKLPDSHASAWTS